MKIRKWTLHVYQKTHLANLLKIISVNFEHLQIKVFLSSMLLFLTIHFLMTVCSFCLPQTIMPTLFVNMWHYMGFYINIFGGWILEKICIIIRKYQKCLNIHLIFYRSLWKMVKSLGLVPVCILWVGWKHESFEVKTFKLWQK